MWLRIVHTGIDPFPWQAQEWVYNAYQNQNIWGVYTNHFTPDLCLACIFAHAVFGGRIVCDVFDNVLFIRNVDTGREFYIELPA